LIGWPASFAGKSIPEQYAALLHFSGGLEASWRRIQKKESDLESGVKRTVDGKVMDRSLEAENRSLRQQLDTLLREAQRNQDKMRRFDQLERRLIGAGSLEELIGLLLSEYRQAFAIESVTLALIDREFEVTRILERSPVAQGGFDGLLLFQTAAELEGLYAVRGTPLLTRYDAGRHQLLFIGKAEGIASVALLPLSRQGELIGSFNFGSANPARYTRDQGTDFLERLAEVVAICIESALDKERLKQVGLTDPLTGINNRRFFDQRCLAEISQAIRYDHPLACLLLDIDRFKRINDTYGHQTGDAVLRGVANTIQSQLRLGDTIARFGGEEFVVLLPRSDLPHAVQIAERIRASIEARRFQTQNDRDIPVTLSIGVSEMEVDDASKDLAAQASQMVNAADGALYRAKQSGRNKVKSAGAEGDSLSERSLIAAPLRWMRRR